MLLTQSTLSVQPLELFCNLFEILPLSSLVFGFNICHCCHYHCHLISNYLDGKTVIELGRLEDGIYHSKDNGVKQMNDEANHSDDKKPANGIIKSNRTHVWFSNFSFCCYSLLSSFNIFHIPYSRHYSEYSFVFPFRIYPKPSAQIGRNSQIFLGLNRIALIHIPKRRKMSLLRAKLAIHELLQAKESRIPRRKRARMTPMKMKGRAQSVNVSRKSAARIGMLSIENERNFW